MKIKGLYQKRDWWYYQPPQKDGKRPAPIALRTKDAGEAATAAFDLQQRSSMQSVIDKDGMAEAIKIYLAEKAAARDHTLKTRSHSENTLNRLCSEWHNPKLYEISETKIKAWRADLATRQGRGGKDMSPATIDTYTRVLKGFLTWCLESNRITTHPMKAIKLGRIKRTRRQEFCTREEREKLLADPPSEHLDFIMHFGFFAGLRIGEMLAMEPDWIFISTDKKHGSITVQKTQYWQPKDKEMRTIELHPRLMSFIERYGIRSPFMLAPHKKLWKDAPAYRFNPKKQLANHVKNCEISTHVTYHTLRHSFATHLAMGGVQMVDIATLLGDELKVVEETYVGYSPVGRDVVSRLK